jgi:hypothetical protein
VLCSLSGAVDQEHDADQAHSERMENRGFGTLLRDYRLAAGLTQDALADRASLSVRGMRVRMGNQPQTSSPVRAST